METKSLTEQIIELMPEEKVETKHDICTLDDVWCYSHCEIMEEKDYPNGAYNFNQARTEMINKIPEILSLIRAFVGEKSEVRLAQASGTEEDNFDYGYDVKTKELLEKLK